MENIGYIVDIITSNNTIPEQCNEIIKVTGCSLNNDFETKMDKNDYFIKNKYSLSIGTEIYFGIDSQILSKNGKSRKDGLLDLVQILKNIIDQDLYLIGWNVSEHILDILESNLVDCGLQNEISSIKSKIKTIDLRRSSSKIFNISDLGGSPLTLENICFFYQKQQEMPIDEFQTQFISNRMHASRCGITNIDMLACCLVNQLRTLKIHTLDEFNAFIEKPQMLKTMPFGKYKNIEIVKLFELDKGYINWLLSSADIMSKYPDLKYSLKTIMNADIE